MKIISQAGANFYAPGEKGVSILVVLMVVMTIMMLATISLKTSSDEIDIGSRELDAAQAYSSAESGLSQAAAVLNYNADYIGTFYDTIEVRLDEDTANVELKFSTCRVDVSDRDLDGSPDTIKATGFYNGKKRSIMTRIISLRPFVIEKARKVREF